MFIKSLVERLRERNLETIHILGDAPNILKYNSITPEANGLVIGVNRTFLRDDLSLDIHMFADRKLLKDVGYNLNLNLIGVQPFKDIPQGFKEEFFYNPVWRVDKFQDYKNTLKAGHSVLIPALHLAMLCGPKKIILSGIQLRTNDHWSHSAIDKMSAFPARGKVCHEVQQVLFYFNQIEVFSSSADCLLVDYKIVKLLPKEFFKESNDAN